jgi:asparagine synthase (glutamine-hydrolysing)
MRFPGAPTTYETEWQEAVIGHVGLDDWVRLQFRDELDYVGPYSQQLMRRHGVRWPINDYVHVPLLEQATTGSFIDGVDGDSVFSSSYFILLQTLRGRRRPGRTAVRDLKFALKPASARRSEARRDGARLPWLTPHAQDEVVDRFAIDIASEPVSYAKRLPLFYRSRHLAGLQASTAMLAAEADTVLVRPLIDRTFLAALAQQVGAFGFKGRTDMMHRLFGELLPEPLLNRKTKATFPNYWGPGSRALAADWQGEGVDPDYVDHDALRRTWSAERIDHRTALLIKSIWLARNSG